MTAATTISEVITQLDEVIQWSKKQQSRIGYFACLYRKMTVAVQKGIATNAFADGKRMEQLDVIFANRYLSAWHAYINKRACSNAWCAAFNAASAPSLIVLQHLLLGINTHINLDLGIAAAETCPREKIFDMQQDFENINDVIAHTFNSVQQDLVQVWHPLKYLIVIANHRHEALLNFSITLARKASWENALILAELNEGERQKHIKLMDNTVVTIARRIINPGFTTHLVLRPVLDMESQNVSEIIDMLYS